MKINFNWKKAGIICGSILAGLYILFLALPLALSPIANSYCNQIEELIKISTGLEAHVDGIGVTTSPKLALGLKIKEFSLYIPNDKTPVIDLENAKADLRLLPLLVKKIQLGNISAYEIEANIAINKMITLIDHDNIEKSNLIRENDIGKLRSECAVNSV